MINFEIDKGCKYGIIRGDLFDEIREHFSVENESAKFTRRFNRFIPKRHYAITPTGRFDPCLYYEIVKFLVSKNYSGELVVTDQFKSQIKPSSEKWKRSPVFSDKPYKLDLVCRDYQNDIVEECLSSGRGTVILATAGGKTLTMASLLSRISTFYNPKDFKCLIIVPDRGLVEQTYTEFLTFKVPFTVSKWTGDDELDLGSDVIIANLGILQSDNSNIDWVEFVDVLLVDEVHKLRKGNKINDLMKRIKTHHRFGFTGTMPEGLLDQWNIIGKIGQVLYEKNSHDLRSEKYIANALIQVFNLNYNNKPIVTNRENISDEYRAEVDFLIDSDFRNNFISKIAKLTSKNCLIMVDYIRHGEVLEAALNIICPEKKIYFICGDVEVEERDKLRSLMEQSNDIVVVAISKIFSTGINIKNLHYIIFAGGGKAKVKIVQSIGRGLRLHDNKDKLVIFDIADQIKYGERHSKKRQLLYEIEQIKYEIKEIKES